MYGEAIRVPLNAPLQLSPKVARELENRRNNTINKNYHTNKNVSLNQIRLHTFLEIWFTATIILSALEKIQKPQLRFVMVVQEVMCDEQTRPFSTTLCWSIC